MQQLEKTFQDLPIDANPSLPVLCFEQLSNHVSQNIVKTTHSYHQQTIFLISVIILANSERVQLKLLPFI